MTTHRSKLKLKWSRFLPSVLTCSDSYFPEVVISRCVVVKPKCKYFLEDGTFLYILKKKKNHWVQKMVNQSSSKACNYFVHGLILTNLEVLENRNSDLSNTTENHSIWSSKSNQTSIWSKGKGQRKPNLEMLTTWSLLG